MLLLTGQWHLERLLVLEESLPAGWSGGLLPGLGPRGLFGGWPPTCPGLHLQCLALAGEQGAWLLAPFGLLVPGGAVVVVRVLQLARRRVDGRGFFAAALSCCRRSCCRPTVHPHVEALGG